MGWIRETMSEGTKRIDAMATSVDAVSEKAALLGVEIPTHAFSSNGKPEWTLERRVRSINGRIMGDLLQAKAWLDTEDTPESRAYFKAAARSVTHPSESYDRTAFVPSEKLRGERIARLRTLRTGLNRIK